MDVPGTEMSLLGSLWPGWEPAVIALDGSTADGTRVQDKASGHKKAGRFSCVCVKVRPRTRFRGDRETPSRNEATMLLLVYFVLGIKRIYQKLGWFTSSFDEIRL